MTKITVFTPSYNRKYCLHHLYRSLCEESCQDFVWLIVDDGSTDNTRELVSEWILENKIKIQYIYKENGGMHTAHNVAYDHIYTELNICIDSDDRIAQGAIESILKCWDQVKDNPKIAGLVGLDVDLEGKVLGTKLPEDIKVTKFHHLYQKYGVLGDKKIVLRTDIAKSMPRYPEYKEERLVPLSYLYYEIDKQYDYACFNEIWAEIDYQADGSSATINKQYFKSPKGFRFAKFHEYQQCTIFKYRVRALVHYGFTSLILKDYGFFLKSPNPILSLVLLPLSYYFYLSKKSKLKG